MSSPENRPGSKHLEEFCEDFHDSLAQYWPHERGQLHFGGWEMTKLLVSRLPELRDKLLVDLCCGEGQTATWLCENHKTDIIGIEIVERALNKAQQHLRSTKLLGRLSFLCANAFELPLGDNSVDIIYGQDPDALAHRDRKILLKECRRILKQDGCFVFHHWIPGRNVPEAYIRELEELAANLGYSSHGRMSEEYYLEDLRAAGFCEIQTESLAGIYSNHIAETAKKADLYQHPERDPWSAALLKLAEQKLPFGVLFICR